MTERSDRQADTRTGGHTGMRPGVTQNAVALAYQTGDVAPRVVARGRGMIAEEIIRRAREHGVFVHESRELVALLMQVDLDKNIPPALYRVVAELLAWLYHIDAKNQTAHKGADKGPKPRP